jgi:hypothetical protein
MKISMRPLLTSLLLSATGFSVAISAHAGCGLTLPMLKPSVSNRSDASDADAAVDSLSTRGGRTIPADQR